MSAPTTKASSTSQRANGKAGVQSRPARAAPRVPKKPKEVPSRSTVKPLVADAVKKPKNKVVPVVASAAILLSTAAASAEEVQVDSAVDALIGAVKASGEFAKSSISAAQSALQVVKNGIDVAAPVVKSGYDTVAPVVGDLFKRTAELAQPAVEAAAPAVTGTVQDLINNSGVDTSNLEQAKNVVGTVATTAAGVAIPVIRGTYNFLTTTDPTTLGELALGGTAAYILVPPLYGIFKGFEGGLTAAAALDAVVTDNNAILIDIRSQREKEVSGVPDVPSIASSRVVEVEFATLEDKKLRGQLKDVSGIEALTTALQIASLKRIGKGTKVILLDKSGPQAEAVARELARKGYGRTYVVVGGFDGRGGWIQSKLQIKPFASVSYNFPILPKTVLNGTSSTRRLPVPKGLPAPKA